MADTSEAETSIAADVDAVLAHSRGDASGGPGDRIAQLSDVLLSYAEGEEPGKTELVFLRFWAIFGRVR